MIVMKTSTCADSTCSATMNHGNRSDRLHRSRRHRRGHLWPRFADRRDGSPAAVPRVTDRIPAALARQVGGRCEIAIRAARPADVDVVRRLALLVDRSVPTWPLLLAESDGDVVV